MVLAETKLRSEIVAAFTGAIGKLLPQRNTEGYYSVQGGTAHRTWEQMYSRETICILQFELISQTMRRKFAEASISSVIGKSKPHSDGPI
jgi:hypothetical protein